MNCYLCGKSTVEIIRKRLRYNVQRNVFRCRDCGLVYLEPKKTDMSEYYNKAYRKSHGPVLGEYSDPQTLFDICLPYQKRNIDQIKHILHPEMKVLDVGCSTGHFLYALKEHVKECVGVDLNKDHAEFARKKVGIKVFCDPIEDIDFAPHSFDLISAIDLIEHLEDPISFLRVVYRCLKPNGYLYIKTPNHSNSLISIYKSEPFADFWFREPHTFYFSPKTLSVILEKAGLKGDIAVAQEYNFLNQMHWIFTGKPQKNADIGMSEPKLVTSHSVDEHIKSDFNDWIQKVDREYSELLHTYELGDTLLCISRKI